MTAAQHLATARQALVGIASVAVEVDGGLQWLERGEPYDDLYSGTAGVLLGCAEAAAHGLDTAAVSDGAVSRLLHLVAVGSGAAALPDDSLFSGWAGVAVALQAWSDVAGHADSAAAAALVRRQVARRVLDAPPGEAGCSDVISGDAGVLLALLADEATRTAAGALADRLVGRAEPAPGGLHWRMTPGFDFLMPGFSHGTAGVAYALASAGRHLDRPDLVAVAARGAEALLALGHTPEGWAVPLTIPPRPTGPAVNYGWCHGPAGTLRLFLVLDAVEPQERWQRAVDAGVQALVDSGLPSRRYPGFWDNLARCCGTAGVGQLVLDRYQATGKQSLLGWVGLLADDVVDRAVPGREGLAWSNTEHTAVPPELPAEPGFMQGAAGIVGWLARVDAVRADPAARPTPVGLDPGWV